MNLENCASSGKLLATFLSFSELGRIPGRRFSPTEKVTILGMSENRFSDLCRAWATCDRTKRIFRISCYIFGDREIGGRECIGEMYHLKIIPIFFSFLLYHIFIIGGIYSSHCFVSISNDPPLSLNSQKIGP